MQGQFTGGEKHKLKIQILEGKMSKIGLQKLTVLLYPPLLPPLVAPSSSRDHERRGSARAPALQALTPKLGIQARVPEATLNISFHGAGLSTARAVARCRAVAHGEACLTLSRTPWARQRRRTTARAVLQQAP